MATTSRTIPIEGDHSVILRAIGWDDYSEMLRIKGRRAIPSMTYLDGSLLLVSPSSLHERLAKRLGLFVMVVVEELDIPCVMSGHTTFRREEDEAGTEPDQSYYLRDNVARFRGKADDIDLQVDPPPDLVVEAVYTHDASAAVEVCRRIGVPEVWVADQEGMVIKVRRANGRYSGSNTSAVFPFLTMSEIFEWVTRPQTSSDTGWARELRAWVRETLGPRAAKARG